MRVLFYSTKDFERSSLEKANSMAIDAVFTGESLSLSTASMAQGFDAISIFTSDDASGNVLEALSESGTKFIAIRAAGYDNVDLQKANDLRIRVANVPAYSPYAIAEHAVALILALNRKLTIADKQVHSYDFRTTNLVGFDLNGKTVGIIGVGTIGSIFARIMSSFGCHLVGYDIEQNETLMDDYDLEYIDLHELCRESQIISIHTCLTPQTRYMINKDLIDLMPQGVMIINTSRGGCLNTADVIAGLETGHIGYFGADVYENEKGLFFYDHSGTELKDDMLKKLLAMPNVLVTPHQAFATNEALRNIATATFYSLGRWQDNNRSDYELTASIELAKTNTDSEYEEL